VPAVTKCRTRAPPRQGGGGSTAVKMEKLSPLLPLFPDFAPTLDRHIREALRSPRHWTGTLAGTLGTLLGPLRSAPLRLDKGGHRGGHRAGEPSCHTCACRRSTPWKRLVTLDMQVWTGTGSLSVVDRHTRGACSAGGGPHQTVSAPKMCLSRLVQRCACPGWSTREARKCMLQQDPPHRTTRHWTGTHPHVGVDRHRSVRVRSQVWTGRHAGHARRVVAPIRPSPPPRCAQDVPVQIGPRLVPQIGPRSGSLGRPPQVMRDGNVPVQGGPMSRMVPSWSVQVGPTGDEFGPRWPRPVSAHRLRA